MTKIEKARKLDWFEKLTFWRHFLINESVLVKTTSFHVLFIKKRQKPIRCRFEWHCGSSSSPIYAEAGEEEVSLPCNATLTLLLARRLIQPTAITCNQYEDWTKEPCSESGSRRLHRGRLSHPTLSHDRTGQGESLSFCL